MDTSVNCSLTPLWDQDLVIGIFPAFHTLFKKTIILLQNPVCASEDFKGEFCLNFPFLSPLLWEKIQHHILVSWHCSEKDFFCDKHEKRGEASFCIEVGWHFYPINKSLKQFSWSELHNRNVIAFVIIEYTHGMNMQNMIVQDIKMNNNNNKKKLMNTSRSPPIPCMLGGWDDRVLYHRIFPVKSTCFLTHQPFFPRFN